MSGSTAPRRRNKPPRIGSTLIRELTRSYRIVRLTFAPRVRTENDFEDLILLSASSRVPLITFWGARWCTSCQAVKPLVKGLIEEGFGEEQGGVSFVEIEMDAPTIGGLAMRYQVRDTTTYGRYALLTCHIQISSMPTLLAFDRSEAQLETKVTRVDDMRNKRFLIEWIEREASRHGEGGAGGGSPFSFLSSIFGRS